jgi:hypothetical protein
MEGIKMVYYSNKARETARKKITDLHKKLALIPLDGNPMTLDDIGNLHELLRVLDDELRREIKENS